MTMRPLAAGASPSRDGLYAGLSESEVREARERYGTNSLPDAQRSTLAARVLGQIKDPMIMLLIGAGAVTTALGDVVDTFVIALVVVLNSAIGVVQEGRAERSLAALEAMSAPRATVTRDGAVWCVAASELVPGDIVHLRGGDIVPADIRLLGGLRPADRRGGARPESHYPCPSARRVGPVGHCRHAWPRTGVVSATVSTSSLGRIAALVAEAPRLATPLQRRLSQLSKVLVVAAAARLWHSSSSSASRKATEPRRCSSLP